MKAVVFAYNNIGCAGIKALIKNGYEIQTVFTHTDDTCENVWFDSVANLCVQENIVSYAPENVNERTWVEYIRKLNPDIIFSFYYRKLICKDILDIPSQGALNVHGSLLPKYRGCACINWAILSGETESGVTLHYMVEKADAGDIVGQKRFAINYDDTAKDVNIKATKATEELLNEMLPLIKLQKAPRVKVDISKGTYFRRRTPADGIINWNKKAEEIRNLIRAVTAPYPGAFSFLQGRKLIIWSATTIESLENSKTNYISKPGTIVCDNPLVVKCGEGYLKIDKAQFYDGIVRSGNSICKLEGLSVGNCFDRNIETRIGGKTRVLILGINGFIGSTLAEKLLVSGKFEVFGMDIELNNLSSIIGNPDLQVFKADITKEKDLVDYYIRNSDVVLPLAAIATPAEYTRNPLKVFNLDFEANLEIIKLCYRYKKRVVFPSTSEVYGMSPDEFFNEKTSLIVTGPICKERWIYSCSKQMLDRVIYAYGESGLDYTIFRPFNLMGPRLDSIEKAKTNRCRAITKMVHDLVMGEPITLVNGGSQKRCFIYIDDAIDCLFRIVVNAENQCEKEIINIGNPDNEYSIKEMAEMVIESYTSNPLSKSFPKPLEPIVKDGEQNYGEGYQDCEHRKPDINNAYKCCGWKPSTDMKSIVDKTVDYFLKEAIDMKNKGQL